MKKVQLNELGDPFQKALAEADGEPVVIEDEQGEVRYSVHRVGPPTEQQKQEALEGLRKLQAKASAAIENAGKDEDDLMREILEDD